MIAMYILRGSSEDEASEICSWFETCMLADMRGTCMRACLFVNLWYEDKMLHTQTRADMHMIHTVTCSITVHPFHST
jgi:hypothetical protein